MRALRERLPGGGFVLLVASWGGLAAFLAWGFREPDLDRAWRLLHEADRGVTAFDPDDAAALERSIERHPEIALDRLGGSPAKFLARTPGGRSTALSSVVVVGPVGAGGARLDVECRCAERYPASVVFEIGGARRELVFEGDGARTLELPPEEAPHGADRPFLARMTTSGRFACADSGDERAGVRISAGGRRGGP